MVFIGTCSVTTALVSAFTKNWRRAPLWHDAATRGLRATSLPLASLAIFGRMFKSIMVDIL